MRQRGSAFVISLVLLAGLLAILASLANSQQVALKAQIGRQERARARHAAESGVQRALAELINVPAANSTATNQNNSQNLDAATGNATTLQNDWAQLGQNGNERFVLGRSSFRIQIIDAASRINVNTAPQEQLERLPLNTEQLESLLDYRETGTTPRGQGGKDEYYNNLTERYNAKLGALDSVSELLQVRGWTAATLYRPIVDIQTNTPLPVDRVGQTQPLVEVLTTDSYSPQIDPQGEARINVNTNNAAQRLQQIGLSTQAVQLISSRTNWSGVGEIAGQVALQEQDRALVLDYVTTTGTPRVAGLMNINTAPQELLATIPGITTDIAQSIVQRQGQGFASLGELASIPGVTPQVLQQAADRLTAISQSFIVRVLGVSGGSQVALEAIVDVAEGTPRLRKILEVPYGDVLTRWGWEEETTTETVLREAQ